MSPTWREDPRIEIGRTYPDSLDSETDAIVGRDASRYHSDITPHELSGGAKRWQLTWSCFYEPCPKQLRGCLKVLPD